MKKDEKDSDFYCGDFSDFGVWNNDDKCSVTSLLSNWQSICIVG